MKKRILLITLLITFAGIFVFSLASTQVYYNSSLEHAKGFLRVYMNQFDPGLYAFDAEGAATFSSRLDGARVTLMDASGTVLGDSEADGAETDHSDREEVIQALTDENGEGFSVRNSRTVGKNLIYYCKRFDLGGETYLVRLAIPTASEWSIFAKELPTVAVYLAIDVLACLFFTYFAAYFILSPVEKLTQKTLQGGDVQTGYPELQPIADVLNERSRNIRWQIEEIKEEKLLVEKAQNSKNEFIANVTHEMNTPLTAIKGYAELLSADALPPDKRREAYDVIYAQSERLTNLVACIINYNKIDSENLPSYEVDVSAVTREILVAVKPEADKRQVTLIDKTENNVIVFSRRELIAELVGNLVRNAIRYNKDVGTVTVNLDFKRLSVEDTGIGISEENREKVFSRFFTEDKSHGGKNGGFGLGLAVCKKICERAGWRIYCESEKGKGSVFTVEFSL